MPEDKGLTRSEREEKVLQFWKDNSIFEQTLKKESPEGEFVFFEGPPTANAKPAFHHLAARAFKDAIPRYKTMRGFHVPRKAGWDTHGLPVELQIEKKLGFTSKKDIEAYGVEKFNKECKDSVFEYIGEWEKFTDRIGYWVNLKDAYYTFENPYIEAVWSVMAKVEDRGLLYKDYKVLPWCPRCGTALSSHELAQGYQDVKDLSLYVKFKIVGFPNAYFLAWTTTPWTLPGNIALAVGRDIDYVKIALGGEQYILAESRLGIIEGEYEIVEKMKGSELVGMEYEPIYSFVNELASDTERLKLDKAFKVYTADFVTTEDGTGLVHTAVMYGQDDFLLGTEAGLPKVHLVTPEGLFTHKTGWLEGRSVVDETLAVDILKDLQAKGNFFAKENHLHSYPFCWRCKTRLIYYARDSWYIRMSSLRTDLVGENENINWEPDYIKEGRFGEWLREVKDWAISRERYWGTPLPVWQNADSSKRIVADSVNTLKKFLKTSGNTYFLMRHGQAENNVRRIVSTSPGVEHHLSDLGREQVMKTAEMLKGEKIDVIIASPFVRTRDTAALVAEHIGFDKDKIVFDDRLREFEAGEYEGKSEDELRIFFNTHDLFKEPLPGGENFNDVKRRLGEALDDIERTYKGKRVLIVTHKICGWLLAAAGKRLDAKQSEALDIYMKNGEVLKLLPEFLPHNEEYELDLHKPFIDDILLEKDGETYVRVKEVMDVWLDSGSMPFAQSARVRSARGEKPGDFSKIAYPADFISEAIDQTRGWFYTLHAVGVLMDRGNAFSNAICLGHILDKEGKKMSKSIGNILDPWELMNKYGVDTLRLWMYSVNQPGESKNFDERSVDEIQKRVFNLLDNVYSFYDLYRDFDCEKQQSELENVHPLDAWIRIRQTELIDEMTKNLDAYKLLEPVRAYREFVDDLSTWYLRRSRDRIKNGDTNAKQTLYFILKRLAKLLAPFAPFAAEDLYQKLRTADEPTSIHLADWPAAEGVSEADRTRVLERMKETRRLASLGLEARSKANMKIRQPLAELRIKSELPEAYLDILKEELNVKSVVVDSNLSEDVLLDTVLTSELLEEGNVRDLVRAIQDMRKEKGLKPGDLMTYAVPEGEAELFRKYGEEIKAATTIEIA
ncbi:MAG: isoleucyl-tRNA synthetase, isoleucyl-tRNA synthetase [Parcubacteria group bacterium]|nr:isoleucyl-tRNA synthetase, isoleucyl-tRNA synthetase [Parcubacteria group bacterium]